MIQVPFLRYFHDKAIPIKLVDKKSSRFMRMINFFLKLATLLHIASIENFLTQYVTTIGRTIYAHPKWKYSKPVSPLVIHELCHVQMWGFAYAIKYVFSKKYRIYVESTCAQAEMLLNDRDYSEIELEHKAQHYVPYGIPPKMASDAIKRRYEEVLEGKPQRAAKLVVDVYRDWEKLQSNLV